MSGQPFLLGHVCQKGIGQLKRGEEVGCPKSSTREDIYGGIGQLKSGEEAGCPKSSTREAF